MLLLPGITSGLCWWTNGVRINFAPIRSGIDRLELRLTPRSLLGHECDRGAAHGTFAARFA